MRSFIGLVYYLVMYCAIVLVGLLVLAAAMSVVG